jgi:hypothetical protein
LLASEDTWELVVIPIVWVIRAGMDAMVHEMFIFNPRGHIQIVKIENSWLGGSGVFGIVGLDTFENFSHEKVISHSDDVVRSLGQQVSEEIVFFQFSENLNYWKKFLGEKFLVGTVFPICAHHDWVLGHVPHIFEHVLVWVELFIVHF